MITPLKLWLFHENFSDYKKWVWVVKHSLKSIDFEFLVQNVINQMKKRVWDFACYKRTFSLNFRKHKKKLKWKTTKKKPNIFFFKFHHIVIITTHEAYNHAKWSLNCISSRSQSSLLFQLKLSEKKQFCFYYIWPQEGGYFCSFLHFLLVFCGILLPTLQYRKGRKIRY